MKASVTSSSIEFVLASSSNYKADVLKKLNIPFKTVSPDIDESPMNNETANELVLRLAHKKAARALLMTQTPSGVKHKEVQLSATRLPMLNSLDSQSTNTQNTVTYSIGVDQVATFNEQIIGKSHTVENAIKQLSCFSDKSVTFLTGISIINSNNVVHSYVEPFEVKFKKLTLRQIENYVASEQPLDCAGSFKCEGQGILLFENLNGRDINSLVGMPLIAFQELCLKFGIDLFELIS